MSLVNLAHMCSHLQNASKVRLGITSVPFTKLHLAIAQNLQKSGYISSVTLGGLNPPAPSSLHAHPEGEIAPIDESSSGASMVDYLNRNVWKDDPTANSTEGQVRKEMMESNATTTRELPTDIPVSKRRLWLGLKYWNNTPVLSKLSLVSKPTWRIWVNNQKLRQLAKGNKAGYVEGLRGVGESMYLTTDRGVMEVREAVERGVGGMLLCRAL